LRDLPEEAVGRIPKHLQMVNHCSMDLSSSNPIGLNLIQNFLLIRYLVHRHVFYKEDSEIDWKVPELYQMVSQQTEAKDAAANFPVQLLKLGETVAPLPSCYKYVPVMLMK